MKNRWNMWDDMMRMHDEMDTLFQDLFQTPRRDLLGPGKELSLYRHPVTDVYETDKDVIASMEIPGVDKKDIKVNVTDDRVEVKVEKSQENKKEDKKKGIYKHERSYCGFYRCIGLPQNVDSSKVQANYNNGVLELKIPKKALPKKDVKQIEVR